MKAKGNKRRLLVLSLGLLTIAGGLLPTLGPAAEPKDSFAKDLAIMGWRENGKDRTVILVNTKTREIIRLKNEEPGPDGIKVKTAKLENRHADTFVELERNGETAVVRYDETFLRIRSRVTPLLPEAGIQLNQFLLDGDRLVISGKAITVAHVMKFKADLTSDAGLKQYTWMIPAPLILDDNQASFRMEGTLNAEGDGK